MPLTVKDAQNAIFAGRAKAEAFRRKFMEQWNMPLIKQQMKVQWMSLTPEQKDALKISNPEMYAKVEQFLSNP